MVKTEERPQGMCLDKGYLRFKINTCAELSHVYGEKSEEEKDGNPTRS
jgi:hypothetical protein